MNINKKNQIKKYPLKQKLSFSILNFLRKAFQFSPADIQTYEKGEKKQKNPMRAYLIFLLPICRKKLKTQYFQMGCQGSCEGQSSLQLQEKIVDEKVAEYNKKSTHESISEESQLKLIEQMKMEELCELQSELEECENTELAECTSALLDTFSTLHTHYQTHNIDSAFLLLPTVRKQLVKVEQLLVKYESEHPVPEETREKIQKLIHVVESQYRDIIAYEEQIKKGGWVEKLKKGGITVSTRREESSVGVLVKGVVEGLGFQVIASVLVEMDLYKKFIPFMEVSRLEKVVSRNCRVGYSLSNLPLLTRREAFFQGMGYNRLDANNTLFLFTRSIHNRPDIQTHLDHQVEPNPSYVQLNYRYFVIEYRPIMKNKGELTIAMNVDTGIQLIPLWLQDKISQEYGEGFWKGVMKIAKKFQGSEWQNRVKEQPQLFLFFKNKLQEHFEQQKK